MDIPAEIESIAPEFVWQVSRLNVPSVTANSAAELNGAVL